jgi:hypothetical protein
MELTLASAAIAAAFAAGVVFHKYVVSEAAAIKEHVTAEVAEVRADIASLLGNAAKKVG